MSKLSFIAPIRSKPHLALRSAVSSAGLNEDALRDLLWLINANPSLIAYGRVLSHLEYFFSSHVFLSESLRWTNQTWPERLPEWLAICKWVRTNLVYLSRQTDLAEFERETGKGHPQMGTGITRHGVPGILWLHHEEIAGHGYPIQNDRSHPLASRYFELQAHILAVYLDCRSRLSTRYFYEEYDGERESPLAPVLAARFSPGVREFSRNAYASVVAALPHGLDTNAYARRIMQLDAKFNSYAGEFERLTKNYLRDVQSFFGRYQTVLGGWKPNVSRRIGRSSGGRRSRKHGYVETLGGAGFYTIAPDRLVRDLTDEKFKKGETTSGQRSVGSEEDLIRAPIQPIFVTGPGKSKASIRLARKDSEASGLAPSEDTEHLFNLYFPGEIGKRFLALRYQRLALEMKAQRFMFDFNQLTDQELGEIWRTADGAVTRFLEHPAPIYEAQALAIAGMTVKLCLCFGQPWDSVHGFKIIHAESIDQLEQLSADDDEIERALVFVMPISGCWKKAKFKGLRLPGICPRYQTEMPDSLEELDPHYAFSFVLPDHIGLGEQLCALLDRLAPSGEQWNPLDEGGLLSTLRQLFGKVDTSRISLNAIAQVMPSLLYGATQDPTLEWVSFAMESRSDEPRMFYTRHPIHRIKKAFRGASIRLRRILNLRSPGPAAAEFIGEDHYSVGARFVLPQHSFSNIVRGMVHYLSHQDLDLSNPATRRHYHNHFVLYVVLLQGLVTTMRLTLRINALFKVWQDHQHLDLPYAKWLRNDTHAVYRNASVSDKETEYFEKTRLALLSPLLIKQFEFFEEHDRVAVDLPGIKLGRNPEAAATLPFFWLDESLVWHPVSPDWVAGMLEAMTEYPIPSNCHRAYVRNALLDMACPPEQIDFHMGHGDLGERATETYSTYEVEQHLREMAPFISSMLDVLGVVPVRSRLAGLASA